MKSSFFKVQQHGEIAVLSLLQPRLSEEENLEELDFELHALVEKCQVHNVIIDLSVVTYLTSTAIGKLISLHRRMARQDGQLVLCSLQSGVVDILTASHLLDYFRVVPAQKDALALFS
ncbi:STAS domain-containing protein [Planctomicrobium sp. SH527]|uniref:STAS domain-containing protein n=1 Tax=Planctomicrobium sp. SH527 TaxID=3448123 RepID=UPI003F5CB229